MYLRSLEIQGFKSFPDKIELKFNKGITAVVGPNGSGKSNIGDAMRWVMGEQSSKALRGENMAGIIFHGTQTRPKAPFAQVTITLDNEDRSLDMESDLVSVSRKLYRNGDSEYMINGNGVRLKDIVELFMDTGLGRDGYSIIGQGRIADIVNGKSNERREIFEEAAGISKFRFKKEEAERKLAAAEDNISRLYDILGERERQLAPLKSQSEKAKQFQVLAEEKKKLEVSVWVCRLEKYMSDLKGFDEKLEAINSQYSDLSEDLESVEREIDENFEKSAEKAAEVDKLKDKIHLTELENTQALSDIAVLENDISHIEENILQIRDQIEKSQNSKYFLETELEKSRQDLEALNIKKDESMQAVTDKENEFNKLISLSEESDKSVNEANNAINAVYLKKSEITFRLENAKNNLSDVQEQLSQAKDYRSELEQNCRLSAKELKELRSAGSKANEKKEEFQNKLNGFSKLYESKSEKLKNCAEEFGKNDISLREAVQKIKLLQDLENSMEGFAYSVKHIMKASKQGRISGICGSVAQLISVKSKYSVAVETALGGSLQNIIVDNEDCAKRCMRLLKENNAGRATFLPVTSVKGTRFENKSLENENGFVAMGCDIVGCDEKFRGIVNSLLGRICIAEDIDLAAVIAKKYGYKFKIVTLDGQVINAGGSFTGGSVSRNTGILTRKNEIEEITKKKNFLEEENSKLKEKKEKLNQEVTKLNADIEGLKEQLAETNQDCLRFEMEIKRVKEFDDNYNSKLDETDKLIEQLKVKLVQSQEDIGKAAADLSEAEKEISEMEQKLSATQSKQVEFKQKRESISEELSSLRIRSTEIAKDTEACRLSIEQLEASISSNSDDSGKLEQDIIQLNEKIKEKQKGISDIKSGLNGADDKIESIKNAMEKAQQEHLEYDNKATKLRSSMKIKMDEKETLSGQITRTEERRKSVTAEFDKLVGLLWDEYEMTRTDAAEMADEIDDMNQANTQLNVLKNKIKGLGHVNLGAIEEYDEVSERYEFMNSQLNDVKTSKSELEDLIDDLTENMKSMFIQTFDSINNNFRRIFSELFGGGKGELILTDTENVLECGIEINVQPPGKVITNLMSLSGGEQAMVAIAIYFAILKISPSPFCLLDEIEAALDDVNVTRYAQYLHHLTDKTQFITITHRRGTMEEADVLYGVTMQEKGISKLLRMSAEDTAQMKLE